MTERTRAKLTEAGMDVPSVMERFMNNEVLLEKFLRMFRNEASYSQLLKAVEDRDLDKAFAGAHTLKGVLANFSLTHLCGLVSAQTEEFRAGKLDEGIAMMPQITEEYNRIVKVIDDIYGD